MVSQCKLGTVQSLKPYTFADVQAYYGTSVSLHLRLWA